MVAFLDVLGNYLVVLSFRLTSLTSVALIDCTTIPFVLLFSWLLLGRRFRKMQIGAAGFCLCGVGLVVLSDLLFPLEESSQKQAVDNALLGDVLALLGSVVYALNNVLCERYVKVDR